LKRAIGFVICVVAATVVVIQPTSAASPVAGKIAFERSDDGFVNTLFAMRSDGSGVTELGSPSGAADASWSPNGRQVAFEMTPEGEDHPDIFVMNADGTDVRRLTNDPAPDVWPDWFPNGTQLAFTSSRDGFPNVYLINADGSEERPLITSAFGRLEPAVSPSGRQIAYMGSPAPDVPETVWVANVDGTDEHQISSGPRDTDPTWSNSGRRIAFASNRLGGNEIFVMNADGSDQHAVAPAPGNDFAPTWSPDDKQIAWSKIRFGDMNVWVMSADGSGSPTQLTSSPAFEGFPDWAPGHLDG
jgi:Tol biopolymer transport system component